MIELIKERAEKLGFQGKSTCYMEKHLDHLHKESEYFFIEFENPIALDVVFREYEVNKNFHYLSLIIL